MANLSSFILNIGFFMSLFLAFLLTVKKKKVKSDFSLILMLIIYSITIGGALVDSYNFRYDFPYPHLLNISWLFLLLHGPLLWLYIQSLINREFRFRLVHLIHLLPFLFFSVIHLFDFVFLPAAEKVYIARDELFRNSQIFKISVAAIGFSTLGYNLWALVQLRNHEKNIKNIFSHIEDIDLRWLKALVVASLTVFAINVLLFNFNNIITFASYYELSAIAYMFASIYVLFLGVSGIRQGSVFNDSFQRFITEQPFNERKHTNNASESNNNSELVEMLIQIMEQEQPYLDPDLTLAKLSSMLRVKPELLSNSLNNQLQQNFFDYINKHRIEEFKIQCLKPENKHLSILGIAYECGFNSKAAFYRAFNKFEGTSPTTYISKVS